MTAIEPPTPSAALLRLALEALRTSACILLHSLQLMQSCESLLPWPFLTLSGQKFFYSYRNMNQGCSVSWATFGERGFIFSAFVWRSKYLGEAEDSFHVKHVCTPLEQQAGSRGWKTGCHFPACLPLDCLWPSVCTCTLTPGAALLHQHFLVKSNSSFKAMTETLSIKLWHFSTWKKNIN